MRQSGIPFAEAGRFEQPRLYNHSIGTFNAVEYGAICPQHSIGAILTTGSEDRSLLGEVDSEIGPIVGILVESIYSFSANRSEDCLFINVQTPQNISSDAALPIIFWIHGGGFEVGSPVSDISETDILRAALFNYNPGRLLRTAVEIDQPVIMVSANHRLNAFGFSASREMEEAGLLNLGLEDQRVALQWVQEHIAEFGGDPSKVTLMGDSSGSWSTVAHLLWDEGDTQGLFRAAIAMSGGPVAVDGPERQQETFDNMVNQTGCAGAPDKIACFKEAKYEDIVAHGAPLAGFHMDDPTRWEALEGLTTSPHSCLTFTASRRQTGESKVEHANKASRGLNADMRDEGTFFTLVAQLETLTESDFRQYLHTTWWPHASNAQIERLAQLYPADPAAGSPFGTGALWATTPNFKRLAALVGDYSFQAQRRNLLANYAGPAWNYVIDVEVPTAGLTGLLAGSRVADADCFFYVFAGLPGLLSTNTVNRQATILAFARTLDPNKHGLDIPHWPAFTRDGRETYNLRESGPRLEKDDYRWDAIEYINANADSLVI
ncbi:uncharacterized protein PV09_01950 [Verruconis gallopava]|uniref:Carboxylic ester hydrolase n=1 Tax=Verruconis gallopava TaxID=253628 RepID=A0A0D2B762_9PEZI|nr:uncharacterized protein PV09_01950 [Verruconis gallopava]KIW07059.1 hypothetical protein PV09_01950 [Verruconis gallopava]